MFYRHVLPLSLALLVLAAAAGCDTAEPDPVAGIAKECNPLGGVSCLLPWPSAAYLTDAETATGFRLDLPAAAMPVNFQGTAVDPEPYSRFDGFSPTGPMLAMFPTGVSAAGLPPASDPAASLAADSATIVLEMATGRRILHFAETDRNVLYPEERALIIRPLERLAPGTRHVVAIRKSVVAEDGSQLPVPAGFRALVEDRESDHPLMVELRPRYESIFAALEAHGVSPDDLVLAWDFVTASDEVFHRDLLSMRAQAMPHMDSLQFTATEFAGDPGLVYRALEGSHQAPNFLSDGEQEQSVLLRDRLGNPTRSGIYDANFAAVLPACVSRAGAELPIPVIVFGHGLFGSGIGYAQDDLLQRLADQFCVALVAGDFIGLTSRQLALATEVAADVGTAGRITEKLAQSIINFIALGHMVRGPFAADDRFGIGGKQILDPSRVYYLGASLGGIMGNVLMAYEPVIERGVLGVPGGAWSLMFERSLAWRALKVVAQSAYDGAQNYQLLIALMAMRFEPYDPISTATRVIADPLPDTPAKQILMYQAVGDSLVTNLATEMVARTMGLMVVGPSLYVPHGMSEWTPPDGPLESGLTIYDEHPTPMPPQSNEPPEDDNGTHAGINERASVLRQIEQFLFAGTITNQCLSGGTPAPCDCARGVCD